MKSKLLTSRVATAIAITCLAFAATARADTQDKFTTSFQATPGGQLTVEVDRGYIEIKTTDRQSVDIEVRRKARGSKTESGKTLKDHVVTINQDGNKIEVRAEYQGAKSLDWLRSSPQLVVSYQITIPQKFNVDLKTAGGSVKVDDLTGTVQVASSGGSLNFKKIEGSLSGHTSGGGITVAGCKGNVELKTSGGGLQLGEIEGDVDARTSGGSIRADKLTGKSFLKSSGGGIHVSEIKGQIEALTSGGSITASLIAQPSGDCTFKTSGGGITVALDAKASVDLDAHTSGGRVSSDLPVTSIVLGGKNKNELQGKINGGGPLITAHTSGGSVSLKRN